MPSGKRSSIWCGCIELDYYFIFATEF